MTPHTLVVLWRVTERCDLACPFCAYDRRLRRPRRSALPEKILAFGAVLGRYAREHERRVVVSWLGGEPLAWRPLAAVSRVLHLREGLALSLTTNGVRLDQPALRALLLDHYAEVTVSVDGIGAAHDRLRGRDGLYDSIAASVRALAAEKHTRNRGPLLRANLVLMRDTAPTFEALCHELAQWGINEITFNQLGGNDRPEFYPDHRLLPAQADALAARMPILRAELAARGVALLGAEGYLQRIAASSRNAPIAPVDCAPGRTFLFVDEAGRVAPCGFTGSDYGVALADITEPVHIAHLPARFAALRETRRARACGDCHSTQVHGKFDVAVPGIA